MIIIFVKYTSCIITSIDDECHGDKQYGRPIRRFHNRNPRNIPTQRPRIAIENPRPAIEPAVYFARRKRTPGPLLADPPDPPVG